MSEIVSEKYIKPAGGFWATRNWKKELERLLSQEESECYFYQGFVDGHEELKRIFSTKDVSKDILQSGISARVNTTIFEIKLVYAGLNDKENTGFALIVDCNLQITDARAFLRGYGIQRLKSTENITSAIFEAFLADRCKASITDEVAKHTYDYLKNRDALPIQWWQSNLPKWINLDWLELVEISAVHYESETADRTAEIKKRQELLELEAEEQAQQHELEIRLKQQQAALELAKQAIEADKEINKAEQQQKLNEIQQQELKAKQDAEIEHMKFEKQKAELEAEISRLRNDTDSAENILKKAEESEQRHQEIVKEIQQAQKDLCESIALLKPALEAFKDSKTGRLLLNTERLNASAAGMSATTMELLGMTDSPAYLAQLFREKANLDQDAVMMRKVELRTRDIGTRKVDSLRINSSLQFEFVSNRSGYATILNIGTSGKIWLQSPNAYVGIEQSKIESGKNYSIPGPELLPNEELVRQELGYIEIGPTGWEELVVIVSDEPIAKDTDLFKSTLSSPFVIMPKDRIDVLLDQLSNLGEETWDVGILSFLVEK